jgi:biotin transport system substrate-specific component
VIAGSLLVAALAQVQFHLPFTPIPVTGQTLGVLLVGAALGPELAAASMLLYVAEGAVGLPFFAGGGHGCSLLTLSSASGGYLWGFVAMGAVVGALARRGWDRTLRSSMSAMLIGEIVLYAIGVPWLAAAAGIGIQRALVLGLYLFVVGDALKLLAAAGLLPGAWRLTRRPER